jgi:hypothetical protein
VVTNRKIYIAARSPDVQFQGGILMANKQERELAFCKEGIENIVDGIIDSAESIAKERGVRVKVGEKDLQLVLQAVQKTVSIPNVITEDSTEVSHPEQYIMVKGVKTKFNAKSFADGAKQVDDEYTSRYKSEVIEPRKGIAASIRHLTSNRFFRGLSKDDTYSKAKDEVSAIRMNEGQLTTTITVSALYMALAETARKVDGFYKLNTDSTAAPSPLSTKLENTLAQYSQLNQQQNITYELPAELAAAIITMQYGKLGQQQTKRPAPAKHVGAAAPVNATNVTVATIVSINP